MRWTAALFLILAGQQKWTFEKDEVGKAPAGFEFARTGEGKEGQWIVEKDGDAKVLAQKDADNTDYRFPVAVVKESSYKNLTLSVKIKAISGEVDQGGGLVWRYQDKDNYYVTRLNVLESNVRLYRVVKGNRIQFARKEGVNLVKEEWYTLKVVCKDNSMKVSLNGEEIMDASDKTFTDAGKIGVWTKADSVMRFSELTAEEIK